MTTGKPWRPVEHPSSAPATALVEPRQIYKIVSYLPVPRPIPEGATHYDFMGGFFGRQLPSGEIEDIY